MVALKLIGIFLVAFVVGSIGITLLRIQNRDDDAGAIYGFTFAVGVTLIAWGLL